MIQFLADDNSTSIDKTEFFTKQIEDCNAHYYISGTINSNSKTVTFCLEVNSQVFELSFTYFQLNDFLFCINDIVIASLCLKAFEKEIVIKIILEPLENLIAFQNFADAKKYIEKDTDICSALKDNMATVLVHYNFIIIILHKFKSLVNVDILFQNINQITSLIT